MEALAPQPILGEDGKIEGYLLKGNIRVVGPYPGGCGGCDRLGSVASVEVLVRKYAALGHVIFEGLIVSDIFSRWAQLAEDCGDFIWALMDTPLEVCCERIQARNKGKPINEQNVRTKFDHARRHDERARAAGQRVVWIDHRRAFEQVMEILEGRLPPAATPSPPSWNSSRLSPF